MPAHNEEAFLEPAVADVAAGLRAVGRDFEIRVVENGSTDATRAVAEGLLADYPELRLQTMATADYGAALRAGVLAAEGTDIVIFDVDYYDLGFLDRALAVLHDDVAGASAPAIVVGSKRAEGSRDARSPYRRLVTAVFGSLLRLGFGLRVSDTHGMKALRREPIEPIAQRCRFRRDLFDTELVLRAERAGIHTAEIPVTVEETRPSRTPIWRRVPRTLVGLVRLRIALWRDSHGAPSQPLAP